MLTKFQLEIGNIMPKITLIGAGSTVFAKNLLGDILSFPELAHAEIALMDINDERLKTSEIVARKVAAAVGASPTVTTHTEQKSALEGADYVINMIQVGGYKPSTVIDFEIPKKYGLRQTIADTLGIGGIMRALRTIPVMLEMGKNMENEASDDVTFLNYVNPMCMNTWAFYRASKVNVVGLCHSVQGTAEQLASDIKVPIEEINYLCAGINHMAFYLKFEKDGESLYPEIRKVIEEGRTPDWNRTRYEMLTRLGYFVTESSEHFAEYTPYFIRRDKPELLEKFNVPLDEYITRCENQIAGWHKMKALYESDEPIEIKRSHEYGSLIIHSLETGTPRVVYGNVENKGLIDNLPQGCCVEVPVLVDKNGLQPTKIGAIPPQLAALMQTNINVQSLTVEAALTGKKEYVYHAAMFDPHTSAELTLDEIYAMVDELLIAHGDFIPPLH